MINSKIYQLKPLYICDPLAISNLCDENSGKQDSMCDKCFQQNQSVFVCLTCCDSGINCFCHECFFDGQHQNHFWRLDPTDLGQCDCGNTTYITNVDCFCPKHKSIQMQCSRLSFSNLEDKQIIYFFRMCLLGFQQGFTPQMQYLICESTVLQNLAAFYFLNNNLEVTIQEVISKLRCCNDESYFINSRSFGPSFFIDFLNGNFSENRSFILENIIPSYYFQQVGIRELYNFWPQHLTHKYFNSQIKFYLFSSAFTYSHFTQTSFIHKFYSDLLSLLHAEGFVKDKIKQAFVNMNTFDNLTYPATKAAIFRMDKLIPLIFEILLYKTDNLRRNINESVEYYKEFQEFYVDELFFEEQFVQVHYGLLDVIGMDFDVVPDVLNQKCKDQLKQLQTNKFQSLHLNQIQSMILLFWHYHKKGKFDHRFFDPCPSYFLQQYIINYSVSFKVELIHFLNELAGLLCTDVNNLLKALIDQILYQLVWFMKVLCGNINKQNIGNHFQGIQYVYNSSLRSVSTVQTWLKRANCIRTFFNLLNKEQQNGYFEQLTLRFQNTDQMCLLHVFYYLIYVPNIENDFLFIPYQISSEISLLASEEQLYLRKMNINQQYVLHFFNQLADITFDSQFKSHYYLKDTNYIEPYIFLPKMEQYFASFDTQGKQDLSKRILNCRIQEPNNCFVSQKLIQTSLEAFILYSQQKISVCSAVSILRFLKSVGKLDQIDTTKLSNNQLLLQFFINEQQQMVPRPKLAKMKMQQFLDQRKIKKDVDQQQLLHISNQSNSKQIREICVLCHQSIIDLAFFPLNEGTNTLLNCTMLECCQHMFHHQCAKQLTECPYCKFKINGLCPSRIDEQEIPTQFRHLRLLQPEILHSLIETQIQSITNFSLIKKSCPVQKIEQFVKKQFFIFKQLTNVAELALSKQSLEKLLAIEHFNDLRQLDEENLIAKIPALGVSKNEEYLLTAKSFADDSYSLLKELHYSKQNCSCQSPIAFTCQNSSQKLIKCLGCFQFMHQHCFYNCCSFCRFPIVWQLNTNKILLRNKALQTTAPFSDYYHQFVGSIFEFMQFVQPKQIELLNFEIMTHITYNNQSIGDAQFDRLQQRLRQQIGNEQFTQMQQLMSLDELQTVMLDILDVQSEVQGEEDNRESEFSSNNESDWSED